MRHLADSRDLSAYILNLPSVTVAFASLQTVNNIYSLLYGFISDQIVRSICQLP